MLESAKKRGRPRCGTAHQAALEATFRLLSSTGFEKLTMEAIAREARLGKPTLYRWWAGKGPLVLEAMLSRASVVAPPELGVNLKETLLQWLGDLFETLEVGPEGHILRQLVAAAQGDSEFATQFRELFVAPRREALRALLVQAQLRDPSQDLDSLIDLIYGPMWYRLLMGHAPLSRDFAREIVDRLF